MCMFEGSDNFDQSHITYYLIPCFILWENIYVIILIMYSSENTIILNSNQPDLRVRLEIIIKFHVMVFWVMIPSSYVGYH